MLGACTSRVALPVGIAPRRGIFKRLPTWWASRRRAVEEDPLESFCPVPLDQQPIQELKELQGILMFDWATLPFSDFLRRLVYLWTGFCLISFPVSAVTFDPSIDPVPFFIAGSCGSLFVVLVVVFRLFLGWSHVGQRLLSETVEYEESGWYDGQVWTKTQECLDRDRLASRFTVAPVLIRLKTTLWTVSGSFLTCLLLLSFINPSQPPPETKYGIEIRSDDVTALSEGIYTRAQSVEEDDYWDRVRKFEPWLFEDER